MKEILTFYRAVDPMKGSWDGYGFFPLGQDDFLAFVADAPTGASIHTPELIKQFWQSFSVNKDSADFPNIQLADALNRLQNDLQSKGRRENILYQATIAIAQKIGPTLYYCCIGDSMLQIYRGGKLYRFGESEIWDGALIATAGTTAHERQKTKENRFIGSNGSFIHAAEVCTVRLKDKDLLLFYTDGIEDLLPPDRLLKLLDSSADNLRPHLENLFAQDKVKDDATFLAVEVRLPAPFEADKEIASLRIQLEQLLKDQRELRTRLEENATVRTRLEKIEASMGQISREVQRLNKRPIAPSGPKQPVASLGGSGVSSRKRQSLFWLIPLLTLVIGTAAGAFLFRGKENSQPVAAKVEESRVPQKPRLVSPPEIPSTSECSYEIQKGDTLQKIASSNNVTVEQLLAWNPSYKKDTALAIGNSISVCQEAP